jgi:hypothetical protein
MINCSQTLYTMRLCEGIQRFGELQQTEKGIAKH